jgi:trk system potassium uptake protein TrkA
VYLIVVGAGKVGVNLVRELEEQGHEVTLIESSRSRYLAVEQEFEHRVQFGDASELWVLERAGIERADMVIAVTGDDEDNILICQVAKEKYSVGRIIARVNNPRNRDHFDLLGISPVVSATGLILNLIEHEVPHHKLVRLLDLESEKIEVIELRIAEDSPVAGRQIGEIETPERTLVITILREGAGFVPDADSVLEVGDDILVVLDPDREDALKAALGFDG